MEIYHNLFCWWVDCSGLVVVNETDVYLLPWDFFVSTCLLLDKYLGVKLVDHKEYVNFTISKTCQTTFQSDFAIECFRQKCMDIPVAPRPYHVTNPSQWVISGIVSHIQAEVYESHKKHESSIPSLSWSHRVWYKNFELRWQTQAKQPGLSHHSREAS
jgi:hypothetical protein